MNLIICVDNKNGIMFNGRRQSRDRAVCEDILDMTGEHLLYTSEYSFALFEKYADSRLICSGSPALSAGRGDYCFAEDMDVSEAAGKADTLVIYCWNKAYPADRYFDMDTELFRLVSETEFKGSSHEKITKRMYLR